MSSDKPKRTRPELIGYTDKLSAAPGVKIRFMVSTDLPEYQATIVRLIHGDENPDGPGFKEEEIETCANQRYKGRKQVAHSGSYVLVEHNPALDALSSLTLQAWVQPTTPHKGEAQGLLTRWAHGSGYGLFLGAGGDLELWLGAGDGKVERLGTGKALRQGEWYFVAATYDAKSKTAGLYQHPLTARPLENSAAVVQQPLQIQSTGSSKRPLLIAAGLVESRGAAPPVGGKLYNGKIDSPRIFSRALAHEEIERLRGDEAPSAVAREDLVGAWDFAADFSSARVRDSGRHGLHGVAIQAPARAMKGHNWSATEFDYRRAPHEYGAIHFHEDDLEDAGWEADFELQVPDDLKSGVYAARLSAGSDKDYIPFFVRPKKGTTTAPILFLVPTLTYVAYANDRMSSFAEHEAGIKERQLQPDPLDLYLAEHPEFGLSIYDRHADGSGVCYASRLQPITNMRPHYRMWLVGAPRHLGADLYLVDWLEEKGFEYDVASDEDLHAEGKDLLKNYKAVLTGTHPEYWSGSMLTAMEGYQAGGGRLMYLGGNGFYWVTSVDPERPHLIEVRRGFSGSRDWSSAPGECHHSTSGELGGHWRFRDQAPNKLVGVGFTGMGWGGRAPGYVRRQGSFDARAAFIFEGLGEDESIGDFGLVLGGTAGDEIDRMDRELGTPSDALLLASSRGHDPSILPVIEDYNQINAALMQGERSTVRADMVYFETPNDGAVFSVGSICWCGGLSHNGYDNNVSRITQNVLEKFLQ